VPEKLASTVYVPTVVGAPLKAALVAVVFPVKYVSVGVEPSLLAVVDVVALKADVVYAPLASVTLTLGVAWVIENKALDSALA